MLRLRRTPPAGTLLVRPAAFPRDEQRRVAALEILVGQGEPRDARDWEAVGAASIVAAGEARRVAVDSRGLAPSDAVALAMGATLRAWRFAALKAVPAPQRVELVTENPDAPAWAAATATLDAIVWTRTQVAEPANRLSPTEFVRRLRALREEGLHVEVIEAAALRELGAGGLLAVGGGSPHPPRLVILRWKGAEGPPVAFVGKGLCFDTGGLSIKGASGMEAMRADMAGAAACAGTLLSLAWRRAKVHAVAVLAIAENVTGARSYRPGDVLRMASGRTVEVVDTDAEGRLVLADALHLAIQRCQPSAVVDVATLTGSVVIALGHHRAGLFGTDAALLTAAAAAGEAVGERLWPMPLGEGFREAIRSPIADLKQCAPAGSGSWGGRLLPDASHAATFLREFVGDTPWAHLDIAGMDLSEDAEGLHAKGQPTGFGVRLLAELAERHMRDR